MKGTGWTGVVLAGGRSSRMGRDKALIEIGGRSLLDLALDKLEPHVDGLLVIGDPARYGHVGPFVIADETPGLGPICGLVTAMRYSTTDRLLVLACDMPGVVPKLFTRLKQDLGNFTDAVVPRHNGRLEPLAAAYHRRCENAFRNALARNQLKLSDALTLVRTHHLETDPGSGWPQDLFRNINSMDDL